MKIYGATLATVSLCFLANRAVEASIGGLDGDRTDDAVALRGRSERKLKKSNHGALKNSGASRFGDSNVESLGFLWKMWHTDGIKWEIRGKDWCVQCQGEQGCIDNSHVITHHCNPNDSDQRWEFIETGGKDVVQINAKGTELCLTRTISRDYVLQPCNKKRKRQLFVGYRKKGKFTLQPYRRKNRVLTMHHHPKHIYEFDGELIYDQPRHRPERTETLYWVAEYRNKVKQEDLSLTAKGCSKEEKCGECQGDCQTDHDCDGHLKCWQRFDGLWQLRVQHGWETPWSSVPGCSGMGEFGQDYCYDPNKM